MLDAATPLILPQLGHLYQTLAPWTEALLRVVVGLALVPHGLRMTFGFFPNTGLPVRNLGMLSAQLDRDGYRPGKLWAPLISATQLVAGPMLALGLFTRVVALPIFIFLVVSNVERRARIHADVDRGRALFPGPRRRPDLARSSVDRARILTATRVARRLRLVIAVLTAIPNSMPTQRRRAQVTGTARTNSLPCGSRLRRNRTQRFPL
jgi:uncharacterized membrane protein YphA (DoxX/SURF4 family)